MVPKTQGACTACRVRKVKCIPSTPCCVRCMDLGIKDCKYSPVKKRGIGNTLRMGQACIPCRKRKGRCDAKKPCTACVRGERGTECTYEPRQRSRPTGTHAFSVWNDSAPGPPSVRTPTPQLSANGPPPSEPPINQPSYITLSNASESASSLSLSLVPYGRPSTPTARLPRIRDEIALGPSPDLSVVQRIHGTRGHAPHPIVSSFTILPSIHFRTIPRPLRVPLSLIPPEHVQVSYTSESDLDMTFRLRALCRLNKLGLYFGPDKREALLRGDTSNAVVNGYFVHGLQAVGMHLCGAPGESPAMVRLQARYAQRAWESMVVIHNTGDQKLLAQALLLLTHALIVMGFPASAQLYLLKTCNAVDKGSLRFLPAYGRPAELSEQVREDAAVLSRTIFLENYFHLTLGWPAPVMTARIEREFRLDLQQVYPLLFDICPLTMQTQSILLIRETVLTLNSHPAHDVEEPNGGRRSRHRLVRALEGFSDALVRNLERFIDIGDSGGVGTIWTCCVTCLGHLAPLCHLISQTEPTLRSSMDDLCDLTLDKLGSVSHQAHIEEYTHFDVLTGISWKRALDTIDARIELRSHAESGSLRHWRGVIKEAYADFQASLRGYGPSLVASLSLSVDGRTGDSSFPNLALPMEREPYEL